MSKLLTHPIRYFAPTAGTFWRWSANYDAAEWTDGTTIAFRHELIVILRRLATTGLPDFELVLMVLAACRTSWDSDPARLELLSQSLSLRGQLKVSQWAQETLLVLNCLHRLPFDLRESALARAELLALVFEGHRPSVPPEEMDATLSFLESGLASEMFDECGPPIRLPGPWTRELRGLVDGGRGVSEERLRMWIATGLERPVVPPPVKEPEPDEPEQARASVAEFLEQLQRDQEFRALAKLARNLMAVIHLPRPIADRDELPLGGISDISNRGPLDRLLLSELAHDNDILMFRVAMQEAMYVRRERPPSVPPRQRVLLLDSGLRMWGVPRVYATAVALSAAALVGQRVTTRIFRAAGDCVVPVDLTTREGLVAHLAALDPQVHPGSALPAFSRELAGADSELLLVTGEDVLSDPEFRRQLAESELAPLYLVTVNRGGGLRLIARSRSGERILREAKLNLDELTQPETEAQVAPAPLIDPNVDPQLPAILRLREFPLRLPAPVDFRKNSFRVPDPTHPQSGFTCTVTDDGRFLVWDQPGYGPLQLVGEVPKKQRPFWCGRSLDAKFTGVVGSRDCTSLHVLAVDLRDRSVTATRLATVPRGPFTVCGHAGMLFVISQKEIDVFNPADGERLRNFRIPPGMTWNRDRFFRGNDGFYALSFDGFSSYLEKVLPLDRIHPHLVAGMFDSRLHDAPLAVLKDGALVHSAGDFRKQIEHGFAPPVSLSAVSSDGEWLILGEPPSEIADTPPRQCLVQLPNLETRTSSAHPLQLLHQGWYPEMRSMRTRFRAIIAQGSHFKLVTRNGRVLAIVHDHVRERIVVGAFLGNTHAPNGGVVFQNPSKTKGAGYRTQIAEWPDGSRAILDSRGLLHLKSSNPHIPEFTLALCDGEVAGWCSDGRVWGSKYFLGSDSRSTPIDSIMKTVISPFLQHVT